MKNNFKKLVSTVFALAICSSLFAQVSSGYYRVESVYTGQPLYIKSNVVQSVDYTKGGVPLPNIRGVYNTETAYSMPSTVLYLDYKGTVSGAYQVDIASQGVTASSIASGAKLYLEKGKTTGAYYATATAKGAQKYLVASNVKQQGKYTDCAVKTGEIGGTESEWKLRKIDEASEYFGILPRVDFNGEFYDPLFVYFPYSFSSPGMKAYCVTQIGNCDGKSYAIYEEVTTAVPVGTPLIVKCSSNDPTKNKLKINGLTTSPLPFANKLKGVYRCCTDPASIIDVVKYNSSTMRILGVTSEGKLGFVKPTDASYVNIPTNTAYLEITSNCPKELTLVSKAEYEKITAGIDDIYADDATISNKVKGVFNLSGVKIAETSEYDNLPSGVYIVDGKQRVK